MDFVTEYGLFLAKVATVVIAIAVLIAFAVSIAARRGAGGSAKGGTLEVTHLNQRYEEITEALEGSILSKKARKAKLKAQKQEKKAKAKAEKREHGPRPRLFVLDFEGDLRATGVGSLREEVTALLGLARPEDEVMLRLENGGGVVHGHGLAASQLARIRDRSIPLTVSIDKVAASGGYMMASVANRILAAPFAIVGSIGVLAQIPNFHRLLDQHGVDFEIVKAGEHKRTLTFFGKNTEEDREKLQEDIESVHELFKGFVANFRPELNIEDVSTGEHWYGTQAVDKKLVDELKTSDDYLLEAARDRDIYAVKYAQRQGLSERLASVVSLVLDRVIDRLAVTSRFHS